MRVLGHHDPLRSGIAIVVAAVVATATCALAQDPDIRVDPTHFVIHVGAGAEGAGAPPAGSGNAIAKLTDVPAFDWCYGCSATSAAMMMGWYDRTGYPNMYTGPTNGGVCPMDNSSWGTRECPLSATHQGYDGLAIRGHVDDYWISSGSGGPDPYVASGWAQHAWGDCTADYMGTNQWKFGLSDGATRFHYYGSGTALYDYYAGAASHDGCYGLRRFAESRGYVVNSNFVQQIYGYGGATQGFTFDQYKAEIDSGRPVMIQIQGHSMVGFGYDDATQEIDIRNTWDHGEDTMTWGGSYYGMAHWGVTVIHMAPPDDAVKSRVFDLIADSDAAVSVVSLSKGKPWLTLTHPSTPFDVIAYGQRAVILHVDTSGIVASDTDIISVTSSDPDESPYPGGVVVEVVVHEVFTLNLSAGWNLVSIPVNPDAPGRDDVFPPATCLAVWGYGNPGGYGVPATIQAKKGYWVKALAAVDLSIAGVRPGDGSVDVRTGWNLIGVVGASAASPSRPAPPNPPSAALWQFDNPGGYVEPTECIDGHGFWLKAVEDATIW